MNQCEHCAYFVYDEIMDEYICDAAIVMDEDDYGRFIGNNEKTCPMFRFYDEYKTVQKQN